MLYKIHLFGLQYFEEFFCLGDGTSSQLHVFDLAGEVIKVMCEFTSLTRHPFWFSDSISPTSDCKQTALQQETAETVTPDVFLMQYRNVKGYLLDFKPAQTGTTSYHLFYAYCLCTLVS